ncbi:MAG: hypothetical protein K0S47_4748 [Herbinix sp.]|jgi:hypothetical protein|nr:hypothetical protein [Herbinix sp.]MDF2948863.1 hypothetical protein [Sedimentibacter sp.]
MKSIPEQPWRKYYVDNRLVTINNYQNACTKEGTHSLHIQICNKNMVPIIYKLIILAS